MKAWRCISILSLAAWPVMAGEITVASAPFRVERPFTATLLPSKAVALGVDPQLWENFRIDEIKPHGSLVKKGEALVKFDREELDRRTADLAREIEIQALEVTGKEELQTGLEKEAKQNPAPGSSSQRQIQTSRLELEGAKARLERGKADLARLQADSKLMTIVAPADGLFLYGAIEDGRWLAPAASLGKNVKVTPGKAFATFSPSQQPGMGLEAAVDEATARSLGKTMKGNATLKGKEELAFTATVKSIATTAGLDGRYRVQLETEWEGHKPGEFPPDVEISPGMTMECDFVVRQSETALVLPVGALRPGSDGSWSVEVKLADGKTEARNVKRGRVSGGLVEILSGIEPGQVVVTPE